MHCIYSCSLIPKYDWCFIYWSGGKSFSSPQQALTFRPTTQSPQWRLWFTAETLHLLVLRSLGRTTMFSSLYPICMKSGQMLAVLWKKWIISWRFSSQQALVGSTTSCFWEKPFPGPPASLSPPPLWFLVFSPSCSSVQTQFLLCLLGGSHSSLLEDPFPLALRLWLTSLVP